MSDTAAAEYLQRELSALFPDSYVKAQAGNFIGEWTTFLDFRHATEREQVASGIWENDPAWMRFFTQGENGKFCINRPAMHWGYLFNDCGVKYRKIRGQTHMECAEKLVKWFQKNQNEINSLREKLRA